MLRENKPILPLICNQQIQKVYWLTKNYPTGTGIIINGKKLFKKKTLDMRGFFLSF